MHRAIRRIDTGQWVDWLYSYSGDQPIPADDHREAVAAALGVDSDALEVVEDETDPRSGTLIEIPTDPAPPSRADLIDALPDPTSDLVGFKAGLKELLG